MIFTIAVVILVEIAILGALALAMLKLKHFEATVRDFLTSTSPNSPSPLAETVDAASQVFARAVITQAKTTLMGMNSAASKAESKDRLDAAGAASPLLGALAQYSPGIRRSLSKNPALLNLALSAFSRRSPAPSGNGHTSAAPASFDL